MTDAERIAELEKLVLALADRVLACHDILARLAERKDVRERGQSSHGE